MVIEDDSNVNIEVKGKDCVAVSISLIDYPPICADALIWYGDWVSVLDDLLTARFCMSV